MRRLICFLLVALLLLPAGGCLQGASLDKYCYVLDLGVERGDTMPYRFVFLLNQDTAGEEGDADRGQVSMIYAEERSLFDAIEALAGALPAQLSFERTTLLAFSRELAEAGEIDKLTQGALGRLKIRRGIRVVIVEKDMRTAFQGLVSPGDPSMNRLKSNVTLYQKNYGYVEDWSLGRMEEAFCHETGDALLPYCGPNDGAPRPDMVGGQAYPYEGGALLGEGQLKTSLCGSAVFRGDRMVGLLSGQHTMLVLMANGVFLAGHARIPWKGQELNVALYAIGKPRRSFEGGVFSCEIDLEADVERPLTIDASREELIEAIETHLVGELQAVFQATAAAGADAFLVGQEAIRGFRSLDDWRAYGFSRRVPQLQAGFSVRVKLSHSPDDPSLE